MKEAKLIWITGASSGIGEALTYAYAKQGMRLIISARRKEELERVKNKCKVDAAQVYVLPLDLEHYSEAQTWYSLAKLTMGVPDILINNGGIGHVGGVLEMHARIEQKVMDINFWGQVAITKAVLPDMIARGSGKIVSISSLLGHYGTANLAIYAASKHAVLGYFESLREEVKSSGIEVLLISPGFVNTNVTLNSLTASGEKLNQNSVAQEQGMAPAEMAKKIISAIDSNKKYFYPGGREMLAIPLKRIAPNLFYTLYGWMAKRAKKE